MKNNVNGQTRAGNLGKKIQCPKCSHTATVFHFGWTRAGCHGCSEMIDKKDWILK